MRFIFLILPLLLVLSGMRVGESKIPTNLRTIKVYLENTQSFIHFEGQHDRQGCVMQFRVNRPPIMHLNIPNKILITVGDVLYVIRPTAEQPESSIRDMLEATTLADFVEFEVFAGRSFARYQTLLITDFGHQFRIETKPCLQYYQVVFFVLGFTILIVRHFLEL